MKQLYAFQGQMDNRAKAMSKRASVSTKKSIEICNSIKGKRTDSVKTYLEGVIALKTPVKITRFTDGAAHKPGVGPGKYPVKAAKEFLELVKSAEANAQHKGLGSDLIIVHATAHQASRGYRYGRQRSRKEKSTHIEIVVEEAPARKRKTEAKPEPKETKKDVPKEKPAKGSDEKKEKKDEKKSKPKEAKK